jgi:rhomboid protease GluP
LLHFYQGDFKGASADLLRALELRSDIHAALFRYLARKSAGEVAEAELKVNAKHTTIKVWPYAFAELYLGKRLPQDLMHAAVKQSDRCQAQFYIGEWQILKNNAAEGVAALNAAAEICPKDAVEYKAAIAESKRLKP